MLNEVFTVKAEHMKLLKRLHWDWNICEFGAPSVECKRPYGNSDVIQDIIKIVGDEAAVCPHCGELIDELDEAKYTKLHDEMKIVLNILSQNAEQGIQAGQRFVNKQYTNTWVREADND